jgi:hypothetical protein
MDLEACKPLLLSEEKAALLVDGGFILFLPLLDAANVASDLLHGQLVEVKQGLYQDSDLLEWLRDDVKKYRHYLCLGDLATKDDDAIGEAGDAPGEVIDGFPILEVDSNELFHELFCILTHPLDTNSVRLDRLPRRLSSVLHGEGGQHLLQHRSKYGGECQLVLSVLDDVLLLWLDGVPQALHLHIHPHQQRPFVVVGSCQHWVLHRPQRLLDHSFYHDTSVVIMASASRWWRWRHHSSVAVRWSSRTGLGGPP